MIFHKFVTRTLDERWDCLSNFSVFERWNTTVVRILNEYNSSIALRIRREPCSIYTIRVGHSCHYFQVSILLDFYPSRVIIFRPFRIHVHCRSPRLALVLVKMRESCHLYVIRTRRSRAARSQRINTAFEFPCTFKYFSLRIEFLEFGVPS